MKSRVNYQVLGRGQMTDTDDFRDQIIAAIPGLRAFGMSLSSNADRADDLVQETLMKAWKHQDSFERGTNLRAWLYTILRNEFCSQIRKRRREIEDADGIYASKVATPPEQNGHLDLADMKTALAQVPEDQREAIILVGALGFSYQEAGEICGIAVGTVKSRVSRARAKLAAVLGVEQTSSTIAPEDLDQVKSLKGAGEFPGESSNCNTNQADRLAIDESSKKFLIQKMG